MGPIGLVLASTALAVGTVTVRTPADASPAPRPGDVADAAELTWTAVVNNNDLIPPLGSRNFHSYNQPSVNLDGHVVVRARSRGGTPAGPPIHGIYTRDMSVEGPIVSVLDRATAVPSPNNLGATIIETPSFPRIDMSTDTIATRANHEPVWRHLLDDGSTTRTGTTGIYTNPFGPLITGASGLGGVPEFDFFQVPGLPGVPFDVYPGSPSITRGDTIVIKGNSTVEGIERTGVYFRELEDGLAGGTAPVVRIADTASTTIPGTTTLFGSTAPPSAAGDLAVFAGFDDEDAPTRGGIYLARLEPDPVLTELVAIGDRVPGGARTDTFRQLGEGVAFDGRFIGFWGAWGDRTRTLRLHCPTEGNRDRIDYCNQRLVCAGSGEILGASDITCDQTGCYQDRQVPVDQGIFVHDIATRTTRGVAATGETLDDFLYWSFSGRTPCSGGGHSSHGAADVGETACWRSSAFVAVSGLVGATYRATFKARSGELVDGAWAGATDGIHLRTGPGQGQPIKVVLDTTMDGTSLDPEAPVGSRITELGLEREGLRGNWLAVSAKMAIDGGTEDDGMAGVYTTLLDPPQGGGVGPQSRPDQ